MSDGESIGDRAGQLRSVAVSVPAGTVSDLVDEVERIRDQLAYVVGDTNAEVVGEAQRIADAATDVFRSLVALRETLHNLGEHHAGGSSGGSAPTAPTPPTATTATGRDRPPGVRGVDGSEYPAAAAWGVGELPARVQGRRDKTVGRIKINDRVLPVPIESGMDTWADHAGERLRRLGIPDYLRSHVEVKLAALMIDTEAQHGEAVINHAPCGSEPDTSGGCHENLEAFIPRGHSLTVHGTTRNGQPFTHVYRGKA